VAVRVAGPVPFYAPLFVLSTILSLATLAAGGAFVVTHGWLDDLPTSARAPLACLPLAWVAYSTVAAYATLADEYRTNPQLRKHFDAVGTHGGLALLAAFGLAGPAILLLGAHLLLSPHCAELSERCKQMLERWSIGMHFLLDLPVLAAVLVTQWYLQATWDLSSQLTVGLCAASLVFNLPGNISKTMLSSA